MQLGNLASLFEYEFVTQIASLLSKHGAEAVREMAAWAEWCNCASWVHPTSDLWYCGLEVNFHLPVFPFVWQKGCKLFSIRESSCWHPTSAAISLYHYSYCG